MFCGAKHEPGITPLVRGADTKAAICEECAEEAVAQFRRGKIGSA
jgi:hypothetical protein